MTRSPNDANKVQLSARDIGVIVSSAAALLLAVIGGTWRLSSEFHALGMSVSVLQAEVVSLKEKVSDNKHEISGLRREVLSRKVGE